MFKHIVNKYSCWFYKYSGAMREIDIKNKKNRKIGLHNQKNGCIIMSVNESLHIL